MNQNTLQQHVTYEYIQLPDATARVLHAVDTLTRERCRCLETRFVIPSDEVGENSNTVA